jgi:LytS/YehU family sensor histidine kinase
MWPSTNVPLRLVAPDLSQRRAWDFGKHIAAAQGDEYFQSEVEHTRMILNVRNLGVPLVGLLVWIVVMMLIGLVTGIFLAVTLWIVSILAPATVVLAGIGTLLLLPLLMVPAISRKSRNFCGNSVAIVTYLWGAALWMWATLVFYQWTTQNLRWGG